MGFPASPPQKPHSGRKARKVNQLSLTNLPPQIMVEILSWLPPKSIIQCKCVCKKWLELITDPYFVRLQFAHTRPGLVIHQSQMFKKHFQLVDFDDARDRHNIVHPDATLRFNPNPLSRYPYPDSNIVVDGSVNGLLFLRDINYKHEALYVCNPLTRQYIKLPYPQGVVQYPNVVTHGFGVTNKTREYKVVRILHERELHPISGACLRVPHSECQVYTLGVGEWRSIGGAPFAYYGQLIGVFFKGYLHWLIQDLEGSELISCFDLENETFRPFPAPFPGRKVLGSLGVLKGCLSLCDNDSEFEIDIWLMKEYGIGQSWGKEFVIKKMPQLVGPTFEIVYAVKVFGDGGVLLMWGDNCMLYYSSERKVLEGVDVDQPRGPNCIEATNYVPSFMDLGSLVKGNVVTF